MALIDVYRDQFGVEPICQVLEVARPLLVFSSRTNSAWGIFAEGDRHGSGFINRAAAEVTGSSHCGWTKPQERSSRWRMRWLTAAAEGRTPAAGHGLASLTPTELEVVKLVGEHLTNPEIAARMFVSLATVKTHLVLIFTKLGIGSRSELVAEVVRRRADRLT